MSGPLFAKVLIANRGEIACRILRTCRRLGVATVAVYSDADAASLHVRSADEAVHLGGSPAQESYLAIGKVIAAAQRTGASAIHPGYGFLSENEAFAAACAEAAITFIGPPASAIRAMGSKSAAKALMQAAGVPLTPGYHGENQAPEFLLQQAEAIGYPVLIKASAGGGGKGMRRVDRAEDFLASLASCKREAASSFGEERVLLERYVLQPRHIEIQVFADGNGEVVSLFERDCSLQRRHQKVIEEAPAPGMTEERRAAMGKAACDAARAVGYVGAGTVEFIVDAAGGFHFMEMNTRLQVEHPVTEMITGLDLVEWQLRIAAGEPLPLRQEQLRIEGHAIEARLYAEDPEHGFLPSTGKLIHFREPAASRHVRVDAGVAEGDEITPFYDPMIGKLIVWDSARPLALARMQRALQACQLVGVETNVAFLEALVTNPSFVEGRFDTGLIEREKDRLLAPNETVPDVACVLAALAVVLREQEDGAQGNRSPWTILDGWRMGGRVQRTLQFLSGDKLCSLAIAYGASEYRVRIGDREYAAAGTLRDKELAATIDGLRTQATVVEAAGVWHVFFGGRRWPLRRVDPLASRANDSAQEGSLLAPIPGRVTMLLVQPGERVAKGTPLMVLEAMKMEYTIAAPAAGSVRVFAFGVGDQVPEGKQLLEFERDAR